MIKLDIGTLIFFYTFFSAIIILFIWVLSGGRKDGARLKKIDYIWKCSVCSHIYVDSRREDMSACPLCGSYNKKES